MIVNEFFEKFALGLRHLRKRLPCAYDEFASGIVQYLYNECGHGGCTTKLEQALYDYWPGYKLGTCVNNGDCTAGQWTMASVETAIDIAAGGAGQEFKAAIAGVREIYKAGIKDLGAFGMDLVRAGGGPEMVARLVVDMRNQLKDIGRGPLASLLKGWHQPSADQLLKEKGSWLNVIQGSQRSNAGWNKALGAAQ